MAEENKLGFNVAKVFATLVLKNDGSRIYSKYYTKICASSIPLVQEGNLNDLEVQKEFEKNIYEKSKKLTTSKTLNSNENEIFTYSHFNIVFKTCKDISIFVVGEYEENELLLSQVLNTIYDALNYFCKGNISRKTAMDNFENLVLIVDEVIDEGIIITTEYVTVIARATMKDTESVKLANFDGSFGQVFDETKKKLMSKLATQG